jgi:hypothetical protein
MALTVNLEELKKDFRIYGILKGIDTFEKVPFRKGSNPLPVVAFSILLVILSIKKLSELSMLTK